MVYYIDLVLVAKFVFEMVSKVGLAVAFHLTSVMTVVKSVARYFGLIFTHVSNLDTDCQKRLLTSEFF